MRNLSIVGALLALSAPLAAQNLIPEGDFEQAGATWTLTAFNDPAGSTGFRPARVQNQGPSGGLVASFVTLTSVRSATFRSTPFMIPVATAQVGFAAMWDKQSPPPIPYPSVNRVEMRILDASNAQVAVFTLQSPNQTGLQERATLSGTLNVTPGMYTIELFLRHSNLAGVPFDCWVDDIYVGSPAVSFFGAGCAGSGGFVPKLHTSGTPKVGNANFSVDVFDGVAGGVAFAVIGVTNSGPPLPLPLGGGCDGLVLPLATAGRPMTGTGIGDGTASLPLPISNTPSLAGVTLFVQWLCLDPAAPNPFGLTTTAGMGMQIQA